MDDDTLFALDLLKKMAALLKPKERLPRKQLTDVLTQNYGVTPRRAQEVVGGIAGIRWSRSPTEPSPQQTEVHPSGSHRSGFSRSLLILSTEGPANLPSPTSEVPATSRAPRNLNVSGFKGVWRRATAKEPPEPKGTAVTNSSRPQRSRSAPITSSTLNLGGDQSRHRARTLPSTLGSRTGQQPTTSASTSTSWFRLASHALQRLQEYFRRHPSPNRVSSLHSSPAVNAIDLDTGSKPTAEPSSRTRPFA
ncbi:hypothetical protein HYDPIDRAFT_166134 [Hydnomerulius pinastri MD-312]|nr:hypothetical protein HYDPIDRAFT_166134 [Hydnomerulius pinastri MD-312]